MGSVLLKAPGDFPEEVPARAGEWASAPRSALDGEPVAGSVITVTGMEDISQPVESGKEKALGLRFRNTSLSDWLEGTLGPRERGPGCRGLTMPAFSRESSAARPGKRPLGGSAGSPITLGKAVSTSEGLGSGNGAIAASCTEGG